MALLSFSSNAEKAGTAITVTLDKAALINIVTDPYYEDEDVWSRVIAVFRSSLGQVTTVDVTSGSGTFVTSNVADKGTWTVRYINIFDYDSGTHRVTDGVSEFSLGVVGPDKPSITSPTNLATDTSIPLTVTSSAYNVSGQTNDTHVSSDWVFKLADGTTVYSSREDASNLTSIEITEANGFSTGTTYYARVRHTGASFGASPWSDVISFTTASAFIPAAEASYDFTDGNLTDDSIGTYTLSNIDGVTGGSTDGAIFSNNGSVDTGQAHFTQATLLDSVPTSFAIEVYFKIDSLPSVEAQIFKKSNLLSDQIIFNIDSAGKGFFRFREDIAGVNTTDFTTNNALSGSFNFGTTNFYHVVYVWSSTQGQLVYVDGVKEFENSGNTTLLNDGSQDDFAIGTTIAGQFGLNGKIKHFNVFYSEITASDVTDLYNVRTA